MALIWMRAETKARERRAPIAPADAAKLIAAGHELVVERSADRAIPDAAYAAAGARLAPAGSWVGAPAEAFVVAVKELPESDRFPLTRRHIHFGHLFKDQPGWRDGLARFRDGGGALYDLEYLTDETGRRIAAFGYWAGYAGAALGLLLWAGLADGQQPPLPPVEPVANREALAARVKAALAGRAPRVMVIGALGRCGRGACDLIEAAGAAATKWDIAETSTGGPFPEILEHDVLVNAVLAAPGIPVFVPAGAPRAPGRRLTAIADVSCDPGSAYNPIPVYRRTTTFDDPAIVLETEGAPLAVTAIDHLPSLLPVESTEDYSAQLLPALMALDRPETGVWGRARAEFERHLARL